MRIFLTALLISSSVFIHSAHAQTTAPKQIGKYGDWTAFMMTQDGRKVCYMAAFPKKKEGKYTQRGEVYALVTHRPRENSFNVVSFQAGYPFASEATILATIDGKQKYTLFTESETAWAPREVDSSLTQAISRGTTMVITGKSRRGTATKDTYSLKGSIQALRAINKACGR